MKVRIKKLTDKAIIPTFGSAGSAGGDLYSAEENQVEKWAKMGVMAVEMEAAGLYMTAATTLCCVWLYILLRSKLQAKHHIAVGWPLMVLPPLPWVVTYLFSGGVIVG